MKKTIKKTIAIFTLIAAVLFSVGFLEKYICLPLEHDVIRNFNFHKEPDNSLDVVFLGSSSTYHSISSVHAYEKHGFTSFPYALAGAPCSMWKPAIKDILNHQNPKLVVIDVFGGGYDLDYLENRTYPLFIVMTNARYSIDKYKSAVELSERTEGVSPLTYFFPIIKYHSSIPSSLLNVSDRIKAGISAPGSPLKGSYLRTKAKRFKKVQPFTFSEETKALDESTEETIVDFIDYCASKDVKLLFVKYPSVIPADDEDEVNVHLRSNRILEIAKEKGCSTLNLQKGFYEVGLDESQDFQNHGHTNIRGQKKITDYLGRYIRDEFGIEPSELSADNKKAWDDCIPYYHAYDELSEYLMSQKKGVILDEYPELTDDLKAIIDGTPVEEVAAKYLDD